MIDGGPWSFEQSPLICHRLESTENANNVLIKKLNIWVQVDDWPSGMLSERVFQALKIILVHL